jgi:hypothetical protein
MEMNMARNFKVWDYRVSHSQLLIRSCGIYDGHPDGNVDLIFGGVFYMHFENISHGFKLMNYEPDAFLASDAELMAAPGFDITESRIHGNLYVLTDGTNRGFVGAAFVRVRHNQLGSMETSLELP